jgi:hypothetical protein
MGRGIGNLCGQRLDTRRAPALRPLSLVDVAVGSGVIVAPTSCIALIWLFGAGGSGASGNGTGAPSGGGGGAALFKRARLSRGQTVNYSVGAPGPGATDGNGVGGGDTTAVLPGGILLTAGGGQGGIGLTPAPGGMARNGDVNRAGGASSATSTGSGGGIGGGSGGATGGGGGGAGFGDLGPPLGGGDGSNGTFGIGPSSAGSLPGGGSGAAHSGFASGSGGAGRVVVWLVRLVDS